MFMSAEVRKINTQDRLRGSHYHSVHPTFGDNHDVNKNILSLECRILEGEIYIHDHI